MEEIFTVFAESISSFIMLSLNLQSQNQAPSPPLRPAADAVSTTATTLATIARQKSAAEYADYEDIAADMNDCAARVEAAAHDVTEAIASLFSSEDRARGWQRLVQATQKIASHTSRLLLTVFGAEFKRLKAAGEALLRQCAATHGVIALGDAQLNANPAALVEAVQATSADLMVFCAYVKGRAREVEEERRKKQLSDAGLLCDQLNQQVVDACNDALRALHTNAPRSDDLPQKVQKIYRLTRAVLGMIDEIMNGGVFTLLDMGGGVAAPGFEGSSPLHDAARDLKKELAPLFPANLSGPQVKAQAARADNAAHIFGGLARSQVGNTSDLARRARLEEALRLLNAERTKLAQAATRHVATPSSATCNVVNAAAREMDALVDRFMGDVVMEATLSTPGSGSGMSTAPGAIAAAAESARAAVKRVQEGAAIQSGMDDGELAGCTSDASKKLCKLIEHLRAKMNAPTTASAMKGALDGQIRALLADNIALVRDVNLSLTTRTDAGLARIVDSTCIKTLANIDGAVAIAGKSRKPVGFEGEIDQAAANIRDAANEFRNLPASLQANAKSLAELMAKLAEAARTGDAQGIIQTVRAIAEMVNKIKAECKQMAANCRDPKLKDSIFSSANSSSSFGMQLKILGAVKAAQANSKDPTAEATLVACCNGIAENVRVAMFGCETGKRTKTL